MLSGVAQRLPNFVDRGAQTVIEVDSRFGAPNLVAKFVPGHDLAGLAKEDSEKLEWLSLKLNPNSRLPEIAGSQIHLENPKLEPAVVDGCVLDHGELRRV
jgi:hypothetical protein